jgi:hypothetical protein
MKFDNPRKINHFPEKLQKPWYLNSKHHLLNCPEEEYRNEARQLGIELVELKPNLGLRFIAQICSHSLWGKFGQNTKVTRREYIGDIREVHELVLNKRISKT